MRTRFAFLATARASGVLLAVLLAAQLAPQGPEVVDSMVSLRSSSVSLYFDGVHTFIATWQAGSGRIYEEPQSNHLRMETHTHVVKGTEPESTI